MEFTWFEFKIVTYYVMVLLILRLFAGIQYRRIIKEERMPDCPDAWDAYKETVGSTGFIHWTFKWILYFYIIARIIVIPITMWWFSI